MRSLSTQSDCGCATRHAWRVIVRFITGFDILAKFFSDRPRLDAFTSALDQCANGAAMEAINLFNQ
jgi:hypothetical protein